MYEHWRGHGYIRIHCEGCRYSQSNRKIDRNAEHAMYLDGKYKTLREAENAAQQKVNEGRWASCTHCC